MKRNQQLKKKIMTHLLMTMLKMRTVKAHTIQMECNHLMSLLNKTNQNAQMNKNFSKLTRSPSEFPKIKLRTIGMNSVKDILNSGRSFTTWERRLLEKNLSSNTGDWSSIRRPRNTLPAHLQPVQAWSSCSMSELKV